MAGCPGALQPPPIGRPNGRGPGCLVIRLGTCEKPCASRNDNARGRDDDAGEPMATTARPSCHRATFAACHDTTFTACHRTTFAARHRTTFAASHDKSFAACYGKSFAVCHDKSLPACHDMRLAACHHTTLAAHPPAAAHLRGAGRRVRGNVTGFILPMYGVLTRRAERPRDHGATLCGS